MTTHDLTWQIESVEQKIMRAEHHLKNLMPLVARPVSRDLYAIDREMDSDGRTEIFRFRQVQQPPPQITLILGDFLANLHSALNHMAFALHWAHSGPPSNQAERDIQYPLVSVADKYATPYAHFMSVAARRLGGVHPDAIAIIERNQPYHSGNAAFGWLYELARIDRHRRLNVCFLGASGVSWVGEPDGTWTRLPGPERLDDGTVLGAFKWVTEPDPDMNFRFTCQPAVSNGSRAELLSMIGPWLMDRVRILRNELVPYMLA